MREPISRDSASPRELAEATRRLDRALQQLATACTAKLGAPAVAPDGAAVAALERDRARLAAELEAARAREGELEAAAAAASQALGRAAVEVRAALEAGGTGEPEMGDPEIGDGELGEGAPPKSEASEREAEGEAASKPGGDGLNEEAA